MRKKAIKVLKIKEVPDAKTIAKEILSDCDKIRDDGTFKGCCIYCVPLDLAAIGVTLEDTPNGTIWKF